MGARRIALLVRLVGPEREHVAVGGAQYSCLCDERGGVLDDLIAYRLGADRWLLVTNAAREGARVAATQQDSAAVQDRIWDAVCSNYPSSCSLDETKLTWTNPGTANVQGPRGEAVVIELSYDFDYATPIGNILGIVSGGALAAPTITAHSSSLLSG